ncbi:hypothetical protein SARC_11350 [Sphaeroforma arctica JP610]|uniref:DUF218 domain-containing protein n=1 Tax=Sphaeroforma arctica JP610 TaxID=667725 RepID=A0A0L0FJE6_9EUKA|nr:hypothetical protein SARC_11350 [Sphaeroforma arctica JP610]KNC76138.1 hypothetical protein SARC_11350 [Sphaeroforma arctica JP610]|eukprot:XP_014150040.1 hypothetical protein SARC_11350 [Sphaeroforma arctica JP610]
MSECQGDTLIVILGSPNAPDGTLYSVARERAAKGIDVLYHNPNAKIVLTGGHGDHFNQAPHAHHHYMRAHLQSLGIHDTAIVGTIDSGNTYEDSSLMNNLLAERKPTRVVLVTSDFHVPRALYVFQRDYPGLAIEAEASITDRDNCQLDLDHLCAHEVTSLARLKRNAGATA